MFPNSPIPSSRSPRRRRWALSVALWAFGLATTTLLVGLWGRSVVSNETALSESARAVVNAEAVTDRIQSWLRDGLESLIGLSAGDIDGGLLAVAQSPEADAAVEAIVADFVGAALASPGTSVTIDVGAALAPLVPTIVAELGERGIDVSAGMVTAAIDDLPPVVLDTGDALGVAGSAYRVRSVLTRVLVIGVLALAGFGGLALLLAENRRKMLQSLAIRLAVSAGTFMLFLRISAWAVDPQGGRSPIAAGGSVLLRSNHAVLLAVVLGATVVAVLAGISAGKRRDPAVSPRYDVSPEAPIAAALRARNVNAPFPERVSVTR
jgi:hypothetical protein